MGQRGLPEVLPNMWVQATVRFLSMNALTWAAVLPNGGISISIVSETGTGHFCCGMGWNATSGLCISESGSGNFDPFSIEIGVAILDRATGATTLNTSTANTTTTGNGINNSTAALSHAGNNDHETNNISLAVGIGVAVSAGVLLVSTALVFFWRLRKRRARKAFQKFDFKNSTPLTPSQPPTPHSLATSYNPPNPQKYTEHVELEHSPRHVQGLGIQELDSH